MIAFQNYGMSPNMYCVGNVRCPVQSSAPIFIMKILYVAFWTFVLNLLCSYGYSQLAWFLLLLPFILFFIFVFMIGSMVKKRTTSIPSMASSVSSSPFYQHQVDAQAASMSSQMMAQMQQPHMRMRMQDRDRDRDRDRVHSPGSHQDKWFEPAGKATYDGGYYSSYSDYDRALDERTQQVYDETHENVKKNVNYNDSI
jgi:hypothetical protein